MTIRWPVNATQAVTAAHGNVAACSKDKWFGTCTIASSLNAAYADGSITRVDLAAYQFAGSGTSRVRQHPAEIGAKPVGEVFRPDRSTKPARMECPRNPVADLDPYYSSPIAATSPARRRKAARHRLWSDHDRRH